MMGVIRPGSWLIMPLAVITAVAACTERIPEGPERDLDKVFESVILTTLDTYANPNDYISGWLPPPHMTQDEFQLLIAWRVNFRAYVHNLFDEVVDGTRYVLLEIDIWDSKNPEIRRTITYTDTMRQDTVVILPDGILIVAGNPDDPLRWDQLRDDGEYFYDFSRGNPLRYSPRTVKAAARLKFLKEYSTITSDTIDFTVRYVPTGQFIEIPTTEDGRVEM